jgi:hypothetical protein
MTTEELVAKAKEFCEIEYRDSKILYNRKESRLYHDDSMVKMSLQRCLGVVQFIQNCGVKWEDTKWYNDYREKFFEILENNS